MPFRFLEHTADARIECVGRDFADLLEVAAHALYAIALRDRREDARLVRAIRVEGENREETLIRWLQELIFLLETESFVAVRFEFEAVTGSGVSAAVNGYACPPDERAEEVKSATYQQLSVRDTPEGLVARITFDL